MQYEKASKRVNSRISSEIAGISQKEEDVGTQVGAHTGSIPKDVKIKQNPSKGTKTIETEDTRPERISQRRAKEDSRSPTQST